MITDAVITPPGNNQGSWGALGMQWDEMHSRHFYSDGVELAKLASPAFTGNPTAPTQTAGNNTTRIATTAFVTTAVGTVSDAYVAHAASTSNPHSVTKAQVGLSAADNTADADKPISDATQSALDLKADDSDLSAHTANTSNPHSVTKSQVGLGNVANVDQQNASNITSGTLGNTYGGTGLDLSSIPRGSILVANASGTLSVITSTTDGHVPTVQADGTILFEAQGAAAYTDEKAQDAAFTIWSATTTIIPSYVEGSGLFEADVNLKLIADLVTGTQGQLVADSNGIYAKLGTTSKSAARGDYGPTSGEKNALAGRGGAPGDANRYLCERFDLLTSGGTPASTTFMPGLLTGETEAKEFTISEIASVLAFRNWGTSSELTISAGAVTFTGGVHAIDTAATSSSSSSSSTGGDPTDNLDTISGLADGQVAFFRAASGARTIVVTHGVGNITTATGASLTFDESYQFGLALGTATGVFVTQFGSGVGGGGGAVSYGDYSAAEIDPAADYLIFFDVTDSNNPKLFIPHEVYTPIVTKSSGSPYTLALSDRQKCLMVTTAGTYTFSIPANATVAFPIGTRIELHQEHTGQVQVSAAGGVTFVYPSDRLPNTRTKYSVIAVRKIGTNTWICEGDME